ncbi:MAG: hypothetical protein ISR73_00470 [Gammaproteobacteria bacterium]|nr:hypothetical protein [Gammaproteobacteria bacterium]
MLFISMLLFSQVAASCPLAQQEMYQLSMQQGGYLSPQQSSMFMQRCNQESMTMYQYGNTMNSGSNCTSGIFTGMNVHPDKCLGGNLLESIFDSFNE